MKILFVAMASSVHTTRYINQVTDLGWDIRLFDSNDEQIQSVHPALRRTTVYQTLRSSQPNLDPTVKLNGLHLPIGTHFMMTRIRQWRPNYRVENLARLIQNFKPDIIHSLEFQHSGYLVLEAYHLLQDKRVTHFPPWIIDNWGNDIYLFNRFSAHKQRIAELLQKADYYGCECERDVRLAQAIGMKAIPLPVFPNAGGLDIKTITKLRQTEKTSARRIIAVKGYQGWAGRALFAFRALARCADLLHDYKIIIFSAQPPEAVSIAAELLFQEIGIPVEVLPEGQPHIEILRLFARSRIFLGNNISDGLSTSMAEAMSVGAFPIQSNTACADEWVVDGETGFIVPPEDYDAIAAAIRRALTDDALVDHAAERNAKVAEERLDGAKIRQQVIDIYTAIAEQRPLTITKEHVNYPAHR
jgi:glycosyltransferase involved in cell wall biosynthesis